jgi:HlyD family secretion protein
VPWRSSAREAWYWWWQEKQRALPEGIAKSDGRIEMEQVEIATKLAGRIIAILAKEGDTVEAGQVVARIDSGHPSG